MGEGEQTDERYGMPQGPTALFQFGIQYGGRVIQHIGDVSKRETCHFNCKGAFLCTAPSCCWSLFYTPAKVTVSFRIYMQLHSYAAAAAAIVTIRIMNRGTRLCVTTGPKTLHYTIPSQLFEENKVLPNLKTKQQPASASIRLCHMPKSSRMFGHLLFP